MDKSYYSKEQVGEVLAHKFNGTAHRLMTLLPCGDMSSMVKSLRVLATVVGLGSCEAGLSEIPES